MNYHKAPAHRGKWSAHRAGGVERAGGREEAECCCCVAMGGYSGCTIQGLSGREQQREERRGEEKSREEKRGVSSPTCS